ncbi:MAG: prolipoprotein diacylglyceryl transferase [Candidatus Omnitrophota bacterium]|jgi:phosphatidylglycerol:prolipoprotein diacylglycerol transferase
MHPILAKIGPFNIYSYGVMVAIGFGLASFLIYRNAARFNLNRDRVLDLSLLILLSGLVGARLLYILLNIKYYVQNPVEIPDIAKGGLVWYGGFLLATLAAVWYIKKNKIDFWLVTDLFAPYIALAQSFGRIGCFFNGCCYGITDALGRQYPIQLYASLALFVIFLILLVWQRIPHFKGAIFLGYCILYSSKRFMIEFFRGDNPKDVMGLTISQALSISIFIVSLILFVRKGIEWKKYLESK